MLITTIAADSGLALIFGFIAERLKRIALPETVVQMTVATLLGMPLAYGWGWISGRDLFLGFRYPARIRWRHCSARLGRADFWKR